MRVAWQTAEEVVEEEEAEEEFLKARVKEALGKVRSAALGGKGTRTTSPQNRVTAAQRICPKKRWPDSDMNTCNCLCDPQTLVTHRI